MLNIGMFVLGWLVFLVGQMQNSVRSTSNGLETGLSGMLHWLRLQAVNVATRAFFSAILYPALLSGALAKLNAPLQSAGLGLASWGLAGMAGYLANTTMFQLFGLIPGMRVEIPNLAPPPSPDPAKPLPGPPETSTGPAGTH